MKFKTFLWRNKKHIYLYVIFKCLKLLAFHSFNSSLPQIKISFESKTFNQLIHQSFGNVKFQGMCPPSGVCKRYSWDTGVNLRWQSPVCSLLSLCMWKRIACKKRDGIRRGRNREKDLWNLGLASSLLRFPLGHHRRRRRRRLARWAPKEISYPL